MIETNKILIEKFAHNVIDDLFDYYILTEFKLTLLDFIFDNMEIFSGKIEKLNTLKLNSNTEIVKKVCLIFDKSKNQNKDDAKVVKPIHHRHNDEEYYHHNFYNHTTPVVGQDTSININISDIDIEKIQTPQFEKVLAICSFCNESFPANSITLLFNSTLIEDKTKSFCINCIRNRYYEANVAKYIYRFSLRTIMSYYYHVFFKIPICPSITLHELQGINNKINEFGMMNPCFNSGNDMIWTINFRDVICKKSSFKGRLPIESVYLTIIEMLSCFNFYEHLMGCKPHKIYLQIKASIEKFVEGSSDQSVFDFNLSEIINEESIEENKRLLELSDIYLRHHQSGTLNNVQKLISKKLLKNFNTQLLNY